MSEVYSDTAERVQVANLDDPSTELASLDGSASADTGWLVAYIDLDSTSSAEYASFTLYEWDDDHHDEDIPLIVDGLTGSWIARGGRYMSTVPIMYGSDYAIAPATTTPGNVPQWDPITQQQLTDGLLVMTEITSASGDDSSLPTTKAVMDAIEESFAFGDYVVPPDDPVIENYVPQWEPENSLGVHQLKVGLGVMTEISSATGSDDTIPTTKAVMDALDDLEIPTGWHPDLGGRSEADSHPLTAISTAITANNLVKSDGSKLVDAGFPYFAPPSPLTLNLTTGTTFVATSGVMVEVIKLTSTGARNLTDITSESDAMIKIIIFNDSNITVIHNNATIKLIGAEDIPFAAGDMLTLVSFDGVWREQSRSLF
jgi:hypothetical protein